MIKSICKERRCFNLFSLNVNNHIESQTGSEHGQPGAETKKDVDTDVDDDVYVNVDLKEMSVKKKKKKKTKTK